MEQSDTPPLHIAHIGRIRDELRALWASEAIGDNAIVRARTHNLLVYFETGVAEAHHIDDLWKAVTGIRPGRVIIIEADPDAPPRIDAWVSIFCHANRGQQLCGELIHLRTGGSLRREIHGLVTGLLAPDLPVYLFWMAVPDPLDHLLSRLIREVDRLLVDSDITGQGRLWSLAGFADVSLGDLAWERLAPWRQMLADLWDYYGTLPAQDQVHALEITVNSKGVSPGVQALLFVGWLADRLGWSWRSARVERRGKTLIGWETRQRAGELIIRQKLLDAVSEGCITAVRVRAGGNGASLASSIQIHPARQCVEIRYNQNQPDAPRRGVPYAPVILPAALAAELDHDVDARYRLALRRAAELEALLEEKTDIG